MQNTFWIFQTNLYLYRVIRCRVVKRLPVHTNLTNAKKKKEKKVKIIIIRFKKFMLFNRDLRVILNSFQRSCIFIVYQIKYEICILKCASHERIIRRGTQKKLNFCYKNFIYKLLYKVTSVTFTFSITCYVLVVGTLEVWYCPVPFAKLFLLPPLHHYNAFLLAFLSFLEIGKSPNGLGPANMEREERQTISEMLNSESLVRPYVLEYCRDKETSHLIVKVLNV